MKLIDRCAIPLFIAILVVAGWYGCTGQSLARQLGWTYKHGEPTGRKIAGNCIPGDTFGTSHRAIYGAHGRTQTPVPAPLLIIGRAEACTDSPLAVAAESLPSPLPDLTNYGPDGAPNDRRNWMVARFKGGKYGVSPAFLIAIRGHENPKRSRDRYALGVKAFKHTNIWVQYDEGARIVARIARWQGWDPLRPQRGDLYRLGLVYVGLGEAAARHWQMSIWSLYRAAK